MDNITKMRMGKFVKILMCFGFLQLVAGCVFEYDDIDNFIHIFTLDEKQRAFLEKFPDRNLTNGQNKKMLDLSAGPFDIKHAYTKANSTTPHWNHVQQGSDWDDLFPSCGGGQQTPINIVTKDVTSARLPRLRFRGYNNIHPKMNIINKGHSVDIHGPWGIDGTDVPTMSGGPLNGSYTLFGVHFHWGYDMQSGAEHLIDSKSGAMEMHMVHYRSDFADAVAAINSHQPDSLAVVGFIFESSQISMPQVSQMFNTLDAAVEGQIIYPAIFPLDYVHYAETYFTYEGSLTTPTCNEIVRWILVESPIFKITPSQLDVFSKYLLDGSPVKGTFREVQPLNGRQVFRARAQSLSLRR